MPTRARAVYLGTYAKGRRKTKGFNRGDETPEHMNSAITQPSHRQKKFETKYSLESSKNKLIIEGISTDTMIGGDPRLREPSFLPPSQKRLLLLALLWVKRKESYAKTPRTRINDHKPQIYTDVYIRNTATLHSTRRGKNSRQFFFSPKKEVICCGACAAAVEAVVEGAEVIAAAFCFSCTFMFVGGGVSPRTAAAVVCVMPRGRCCHPGDKREGPREYMRRN